MRVELRKRRSRRKCYDWVSEIAKGNTNHFYNSTDWDILREKVLIRDKFECQFFAGKWNDGIHYPDKIQPVRAVMVHHIIPIKERPDLALDIDNCVSLSFLAHEIIEDRYQFSYHKKETKKTLTEERW